MLDKKKLLGVGVTDATGEQILEYILQSLKKSAEKYYIVTPNPEFLVFAATSPTFKQILNDARLALCDGIGVFWAGKVLGKNFKERTTGVDLMEKLCLAVAEKPITVGFLGGGSKIAERTAECLKQKYPGLKVVFAGEEWSKDKFAQGPVPPFLPVSARSSEASFNELRAVGSPSRRATLRSIDLLFVAFGFPKQEEWIVENLPHLPVRIAMGVGGAFDYLSGAVPRAPLFIRKIGLEWLFRLIIQPCRLKRQLALLRFVLLVLKEKLSNN